MDGDDPERTGTRRAPRPAPVVPLRAAAAAESDETSRPRPAPHRPPVLASEALRRDLLPEAPGAALARALAIVLGVLGAGALMLLAPPGGLALPLGGLFVACTLLGLLPMPFGARAAALATVAGGGAAIALAAEAGPSGGRARVLLAAGVTVLGAGLALRAWHRASRAARVLVAMGVIACAVWLWQTRALSGLTILDTAWQAWLPEVAPVVLALASALSLLAFMDAASTGGCGLWAVVVLGWYAAYRWLAVLAVMWPSGARSPSLERFTPGTVLGDVCLPLFVAVLAVGLAQALAVLLRPAPR